MKRALLIFLLMPLWCMAQGDNWVKLIPKNDTLWLENNIGLSIVHHAWDAYLVIDTSIWQRKDTVPIRIRPTEPEPAKARTEMRITNNEVTEYIRMRTDLPDSTITIYGDTMNVVKHLFKELLDCQKKSKVDEAIIKRLFETIEIYKGIITVPSSNITLPAQISCTFKTHTATFDSLGNIYFREK